jgi:hypothetical protein
LWPFPISVDGRVGLDDPDSGIENVQLKNFGSDSDGVGGTIILWSFPRASLRTRTAHTLVSLTEIVTSLDSSAVTNRTSSLVGRQTLPADVSWVDACTAGGLRLGDESFEYFGVRGYYYEVGLIRSLNFEVGSGFVYFA